MARVGVYVDDALREDWVRDGRRRVWGRWSRLMADDLAELLQFADRLGLRRAWLRDAGNATEHFLVSAGRRRLAITLGAVEISVAEGGQLADAKRAGVRFDVHRLRPDPAGFQGLLAAATGPLYGQPPADGPRRVRLSRAAGFTLPPGTVSVAAPTRWANPCRPAARSPQANQAAVDGFREYLARNPMLVEQGRVELAGLNLACWCPPHLACHADVWLALVNTTDPCGA